MVISHSILSAGTDPADAHYRQAPLLLERVSAESKRLL